MSLINAGPIPPAVKLHSLTEKKYPAYIFYGLQDKSVAVHVLDDVQAEAVINFVALNRLPGGAMGEGAPCVHTVARTHGDGQVLWG